MVLRGSRRVPDGGSIVERNEVSCAVWENMRMVDDKEEIAEKFRALSHRVVWEF